MLYVKSYQKFNEDSMSSAVTAGMGNVSSAQPGEFAGDVDSSTDGSGDIPFYLRRKKGKKGNPIEVTDLRDLKSEKTNKINDFE